MRGRRTFVHIFQCQRCHVRVPIQLRLNFCRFERVSSFSCTAWSDQCLRRSTNIPARMCYQYYFRLLNLSVRHKNELLKYWECESQSCSYVLIHVWLLSILIASTTTSAFPRCRGQQVAITRVVLPSPPVGWQERESTLHILCVC